MKYLKIGGAIVLLLALAFFTIIIVVTQRTSGHTIDAQAYASAEADFVHYCSNCHGSTPREFASREWKGKKHFAYISKTIANGVANTEMVSFRESLGEERIRLISQIILAEMDSMVRAGYAKQVSALQGIITTEYLEIEIDTVVRGPEIAIPWSFAFLPDGDMLIANRGGGLFRYNAVDGLVAIEGLPKMVMSNETGQQAGLFAIALHPDFANQPMVYLSFSKSGKIGQSLAVTRSHLSRDKLTNTITVFEAKPYRLSSGSYGGRLLFMDDTTLLITTGDRGSAQGAQNVTDHYGTVSRILPDGSIPADNPFVHDPQAKPSIWAIGFRNSQGLARNPATGSIWLSDHGPRGGDELNIVRPGQNYGWPLVSYGTDYDGSIFTEHTEMEGMVSPEYYWVPSIAPCGIGFVESNRYPGWEGDLLVGALSHKLVSRLDMQGDSILREEQILKAIGRVREIKTGPDGYIYLSVEEGNGLGMICRIIPLLRTDARDSGL